MNLERQADSSVHWVLITQMEEVGCTAGSSPGPALGAHRRHPRVNKQMVRLLCVCCLFLLISQTIFFKTKNLGKRGHELSVIFHFVFINSILLLFFPLLINFLGSSLTILYSVHIACQLLQKLI